MTVIRAMVRPGRADVGCGTEMFTVLLGAEDGQAVEAVRM
jgi:hypothetical protein